jgi:hypothetical protein
MLAVLLSAAGDEERERERRTGRARNFPPEVHYHGLSTQCGSHDRDTAHRLDTCLIHAAEFLGNRYLVLALTMTEIEGIQFKYPRHEFRHSILHAEAQMIPIMSLITAI